jgi:hypothetical protein
MYSLRLNSANAPVTWKISFRPSVARAKPSLTALSRSKFEVKHDRLELGRGGEIFAVVAQPAGYARKRAGAVRFDIEQDDRFRDSLGGKAGQVVETLARLAPFCYQFSMSPSSLSDNRKPQKKIGRPRVDSTLIGVRLTPAELERLDEWRLAQDGQPGRPEALRWLARRVIGKRGK